MKYNTHKRLSKGKKIFLAFLTVGTMAAGVTFANDHLETLDWIDESNATPVREVPAFVGTPKAEAAEDMTEARLLTRIEELKHEILEKIRYHEQGGHKYVEGELFQTYDPPKKLKASGACTTVGGKRNRECDSYSVYQMKITFGESCMKGQGKQPLSDAEFLAMTLHKEDAAQFAIECIINVSGAATKWTAYDTDPEWFNFKVNQLREYISILEA